MTLAKVARSSALGQSFPPSADISQRKPFRPLKHLSSVNENEVMGRRLPAMLAARNKGWLVVVARLAVARPGVLGKPRDGATDREKTYVRQSQRG